MISILLASYNGEKYIEEQIQSILDQTIQDFILFINDDCSTDGTYDICKQYAIKYPNKVIVSQNVTNTGNAKYNFIKMMIKHKNQYVMLCDQDDVWLPEKIKLTLDCMLEMEKTYSYNTPILVHTDLKVVDEKLNTISESFIKSMNANYYKTGLHNQIIQNTLTGCTAMYNLPLSQLITNEPEYMVMHDWWLILIASAFGKIGHINEPTILYRQHSKNVIGAKNVNRFKYKLNRILNGSEVKLAINVTYKQAESFLKSYQNKLTISQKQFIEKYIEIPELNKFIRCYKICKLKTFKNGLTRKIAHFLFI